MTKARAAAFAAALFFVSSSSRTRADEAHPKVVLALDQCAAVEEAEVRRIVGVELGALLVDQPDASPSPGATVVRVRCSGSELSLHVDDPITRKSLERAIDLSKEAPKARARLLALAIAELVSASWTELVANPEPAVEPVGPRPPPEVKQAARAAVARREPHEGKRVTAAFTVRGFVPWVGPLYGAELRFAADVPKILGFSIALGVDRGIAPTALGDVRATTVSAAPAALIRGAVGAATLEGGLGVRGGVAWMQGEPSSPVFGRATVAGPWLGPMATFGSTFAFLGRAVATAGVETGYVAVPVGALVDAKRQVAIDGVWLGAQLGVGLSL